MASVDDKLYRIISATRPGSGGTGPNYGMSLGSAQIRFANLDALFEAFGDTVDAVVKWAVHQTAIAIREVSEKRVPYEVGTLLRSQRIVDTEKGVEFGYGTTKDRSYDYAAVQHERLDYNHPGLRSRAKSIPPPRVRQAKYLESSLKEELARFPGSFVERLRK